METKMKNVIKITMSKYSFDALWKAIVKDINLWCLKKKKKKIMNNKLLSGTFCDFQKWELAHEQL